MSADWKLIVGKKGMKTGEMDHSLQFSFPDRQHSTWIIETLFLSSNLALNSQSILHSSRFTFWRCTNPRNESRKDSLVIVWKRVQKNMLTSEQTWLLNSWGPNRVRFCLLWKMCAEAGLELFSLPLDSVTLFQLGIREINLQIPQR